MVLNKIDLFPNDSIIQPYTSLDEDMFISTGMFLSDGKEAIIFDLGCLVTGSPCKDDFGQTFTPLSKTMMGLGAVARVKDEGTVDWALHSY